MSLANGADRSARKPEFIGPFQNVTVLEGSSARLQCRVISDTPVYLQWLKRLERLSPYDAHRHTVAAAAAAVEYSRPDANGVLQVTLSPPRPAIPTCTCASETVSFW